MEFLPGFKEKYIYPRPKLEIWYDYMHIEVDAVKETHEVFFKLVAKSH